MYFAGQPRLPSQDRGGLGLPILGVLLCLCLHTLTQNDQIHHGKTYGEWHVFRRSATPLHLHKCVARFVSTAEFLVRYACYHFLLCATYVTTSIFFRISVLGGCRGQVGGTRFQVGMTGADQRR